MVTDFLDPDSPGGASRYVRESARALAARGHEVAIVAGLERPRPPEVREGVRYRWFRYDAYRGGPFRLWRALSRDLQEALREECGRLRPDLVHFHQSASARASLSRSPCRDLPAAYMAYSPWPREHAAAGGSRTGMFLRKWIEGSVLKRMPAIMTLSRYTVGEFASAYGLPADRFGILGGGVDARRFCPRSDRPSLRRAWEIPERGPCWLTVRRLVPRMGLDLLLEAAVLRLRDGADFRLIVAGDGPLRGALEDRAAVLGLSGRVRFAGLVPEEKLPELYTAADVFILPTRELEGFGLVLLEAMACGTPAIGTPVGAIPEILEKVDPGWIASAATPAALADLLARMPFPVPEGVRNRCRETVEREFTWDAVAVKMEAEYRRVLNDVR